MKRRRVLAAALCGACLFAPFAMAAAADASTAVAPQVDQLHQRIDDQTAQAQQLRQQVQSLKQQQQTDHQQLQQTNQTIERLRQQLKKLHTGSSDGSTMRDSIM